MYFLYVQNTFKLIFHSYHVSQNEKNVNILNIILKPWFFFTSRAGISLTAAERCPSFFLNIFCISHSHLKVIILSSNIKVILYNIIYLFQEKPLNIFFSQIIGLWNFKAEMALNEFFSVFSNHKKYIRQTGGKALFISHKKITNTSKNINTKETIRNYPS